MQTDSAFLDDLIRATWDGKLAWEEIKISLRSGYRANFSGYSVRAFLTYRHYQVSPGGVIAEEEHSVERKAGALFYHELQAPRSWKKELWLAISFKAWEVTATQSELLKGQGYLIRFDGADPRGQVVLYQEVGHRLMVYVEMSPSADTRWKADARSLRIWSDPVKEEIDPVKQAQIRSRIEGWSESLKVPVGF